VERRIDHEFIDHIREELADAMSGFGTRHDFASDNFVSRTSDIDRSLLIELIGSSARFSPA
jgi:hypothetical protein